MYAYGPVPSRRLGNSIGVSPIPAKVCSYSCVYCQLGRTLTLQARRQRFFPKEDILRDVETVVASTSADVITFAGDGEPTLSSDLGWLIRNCKREFNLPVAVITNGSLLFDKDVQADLLSADIILPTLDAGNRDLFKRINRPHGSITFDKMIEGMMSFRQLFNGQFWLEVMLVKGLNDTIEHLKLLHGIMADIQPDKVFVMTPIRPPAENWVECPDSDRIELAKKIFSDAVAFSNNEDGNFGVTEFANAVEAILEISTRHPLRLQQAKIIEEKFEQPGTIDKLIEEGIIEIKQYRQIDYIKIRKDVKRSNRSGDIPEIKVERINCCTFRMIIKVNDEIRRFRVVLADAYYNYLTRGRLSKEQLLKECFRYFWNKKILGDLEPKFVLRDKCRENPQIERGILKTVLNGMKKGDVN